MPVDGSVEMLRDLDRQGLKLGVVTSRSREDAAAYLAQQGLGDLFWVVITRDDVRRLKPHPMPVEKAAEQLGLTPEQCVMVGDTNLDVRAARLAGALSVGVLCGFGAAEDLRDADLVLDSPAELAEDSCDRRKHSPVYPRPGILFSTPRRISANPTVMIRYK